MYWCAWPLIVFRESYQTMKVELLQEHPRDKVRRRFTLLVTACFDGTTGQAPMLQVVLTADRCPLCELVSQR